MFQSWIHDFNLDDPSNLVFPTSILLRNLSYGHHGQAYEFVATLEEVIGVDASNDKHEIQNVA